MGGMSFLVDCGYGNGGLKCAVIGRAVRPDGSVPRLLGGWNAAKWHRFEKVAVDDWVDNHLRNLHH